MKLNFISRVPAWLRQTPIAHRGLHSLPDTPENSLAAFAAAADANYAIELDVRLLRSGEPVVFHDENWQRMTRQAGMVEETDADTISAFHLLQTREKIPLLADVLNTVAGRVPLLIELKSEANAPVGILENVVLETLRNYGGVFALQSFRRETVAYLRAHAPADAACGQLATNDSWYDSTSEAPTPDFLAYIGLALPTPLTTAFRERGGLVLAWTLSTAMHQEYVAPYADNIIFENFSPRIN